MREQGWAEVKRMMADPSFAFVLADEINIALRYDYLQRSPKSLKC